MSAITAATALATLLLLGTEAWHQELLPVVRWQQAVTATARCAQRNLVTVPLHGASPSSLISPWFRVVSVPLASVPTALPCDLDIATQGVLHFNIRRHYVKLLSSTEPTDLYEDARGALMPERQYRYRDGVLRIPLWALEGDLTHARIEILIASSLRERLAFFADAFLSFTRQYWWFLMTLAIVTIWGAGRYRASTTYRVEGTGTL